MEELNILKKKFTQTEQLLSVKQRQINTLLEVTQAINQSNNENTLFKFYEYIITRQIKAKRLVVFFKKIDHWERVSSVGVEDERFKNFDVEGKFEQYNSLKKVEEKEEWLNEIDFIIPVYHNTQKMAYVLLGDIQKAEVESEEEVMKFVQTITNVVFVEAQNKQLSRVKVKQQVNEKEMEIAKNIQNILIPNKLPNNDLIHLAGVYLPHTQIGGDYYDYIPISDTLFGLAIADISGKGIGAGILTSNFQANIRTLLNREFALEQTIDHINFRVNEITNGELYVTFFCALYNSETRMLTYCNAGHNPPVLIQGDDIKLLEEGSTFLGMITPLPFINIAQIYIEPNSLLFMYTDGLTELRDSSDNYIEFNDLSPYIYKNRNLNPEELIKKILTKIENDKTKLMSFDDISVFCCRFK